MNISIKLGFHVSALTAIMTLVTFGIAINTPPISGSFCMEDCIDYPYLEIADRFPKDYIWMFFAIVLNISYLVMMVCFNFFIKEENKLLSFTALIFASLSMLVLNLDYFVQLVVIQPSILNGETDGISLLTQYNPHGIFIALEEFGFLMMSVSFLFAGIAYTKHHYFSHSVRWLLISSFLLSIISLIWIRVAYGTETGYLYEIVIISINWITLLSFSILLSIVFYRSRSSTFSQID